MLSVFNKKKTTKMRAKLLLILLMFSTLQTLSAKKESELDTISRTTKTGYYTAVYARVSHQDMPRLYAMLIEENGDAFVLGYDRYSTKSGPLNVYNFNPRQYHGKTITIEYDGYYQGENAQYRILLPNGDIRRIPYIRVTNMYSIEQVDKQIDVDKIFLYPCADTLLIPHRNPIKEERYNYTPSAEIRTVSLRDFVSGKGTESSPFVSTDGTAGLREAVSKFNNGGVVEVGEGVYRVDELKSVIPVGVTIRGAGEGKTKFIFTRNGETWILKGNNIVEELSIDIRPIEKYCHTIAVDNNARNVTIRKITMDGAHSVTSDKYQFVKNICGIGLKSYITNFTLEDCTFHNVFRSLQTVSQKCQYGIIIRGCLFDGWSFTPISLDVVSDIRDVVIENNQFRDFCHFGVALAQITDVSLRNNIFYSRQIISRDTYNEGIHMENHCERIVIENNEIDIVLRRPDKEGFRNSGVSMVCGRNLVVRNNTIKNSSIHIAANTTVLCANIVIENNSIDNGAIDVASSGNVKIVDNRISNSPKTPITIESTRAMHASTKDVLLRANRVTGFKGCEAINLLGYVSDIRVENNIFSGEDINVAALNLKVPLKNIIFEGNRFDGVGSLLNAKSKSSTEAFVKMLEISNKM